MLIHEYLDSYRIYIEPADLIQIGKTADQIIEDLIEASGLIGKPLDKWEMSYDPRDQTYIVFISKDLDKW